MLLGALVQPLPRRCGAPHIAIERYEDPILLKCNTFEPESLFFKKKFQLRKLLRKFSCKKEKYLGFLLVHYRYFLWMERNKALFLADIFCRLNPDNPPEMRM
jgi:hypothetical protein